MVAGGGLIMSPTRSWPVGRTCEGCTTVLSIYNSDRLCAGCAVAVPLEELPTTVGRYL